MNSCIVISTYNGEQFIKEQLDSIYNQTRKPNAVFIADDCSTDNTYQIIKNYIITNKLDNWTIHKNIKNLGWQNSFVNLIKEVPEKYDVIFMCDQDDIWYSNKIETVMYYYEKDPELGLLATNMDVVYMDNNAKKLKVKRLGKRKYGNMPIIPNNLDIRRPGCALAVKREIAQSCLNKHHNGIFAHDMIIWMYCFCKKKIKYLNMPLMKFRRFSSSTTNMKKNGNRFEHKRQESLNMIDFLEECKKIDDIDDDVIKILNDGLILENKRQRLFNDTNIISWFECLWYANYYPNFRRWFGDLYFTIINKSK